VWTHGSVATVTNGSMATVTHGKVATVVMHGTMAAVTHGEGAIVGVLAEFLTLLHAGHWFGFTDSGYVCSVRPSSPDYVTLAVLVGLYVVLLVLMALQSSVRAWQNCLAAFFYPQHEQTDLS